MPRKLHELYLVALLLLVAGGCRSGPAERAYIPQFEAETISRTYPRSAEGKGQLTEAILATESFDLWTKLVTIQFIEDAAETPREMMDRILARLLSKCPELVSDVIEEDEVSITYEWRIDACPAAPDQHEIARLIKTPGGIHRIAYVQKGPVMPEDVREDWLGRLAEALVINRKGEAVHIPPSALEQEGEPTEAPGEAPDTE